MLGIFGQTISSHNSSQAAKTLVGTLSTENMDVENIILKFNGKVICCDGDWDVIVKGLKAEREADMNAVTRIRLFPVEVAKKAVGSGK